MVKRLFMMSVILGSVFGSIFYGKQALTNYFMAKYGNFTMPPAAVEVASVNSASWQPFISAVGSFKAVQGINVTPEIQGVVEKIQFNSGQNVAEGDLLLQLDADVEQADLLSAKASLSMAQLDYLRKRDLLRTKAISREAVDQASMVLAQAKAHIAKLTALIDKKSIRAPFSGKLGIRQVGIGQFVAPGANIVSLQSMDPLYLEFDIPEQYVSQIQVGEQVQAAVDGEPDHLFTGKVTALSPQVDESSRTIQVQATFPNTDKALLPGMFADIKVLLPQSRAVNVIPLTAICYSLSGDSVYVIAETEKDKEGKPIFQAMRRTVELGEHRGNEVAVVHGLRVGEKVVVSGSLKLHNKSLVKIQNSLELKA